MGWGTGDHAGWPDEKRADGTWSGPAQRSGEPDAIAYRATCSCGWHADREHAIPGRWSNILRDARGVPFGPAWETWLEAFGVVESACHEDWSAEHFEPMLGYEPHQRLVLGQVDGRPCHLLDGLPVHAGASLQLLAADGHWLAMRYEWTSEGRPPTAHVALGVPAEARRQGVLEVVELSLAPRAILRWPPPEKA
jgi:hypothetical protein